MPKWFAKNILFSKTIGSLGPFMYTKKGVAPSILISNLIIKKYKNCLGKTKKTF